MFVAVSTRCFADEEIWSVLRRLVDMEFDKFDLWLDEAGSHSRPSDILAAPDPFVAQIREQTRLTPVSVTLGNDPTLDEFRALCQIFRRLRVTQFNVPASPLGTPFNSEIDRLKELVQIGKVEGIRAAIRTERGTLAEDPHTAVELCQAAKGLGLAFDPSYFLRGDFRKNWARIAPLTTHVFLRDSTAEQVQVQVGLGELDYSDLIADLQLAGFDRALSIELFPEQIQDLDRALEVRKMRLLLESLL